MNQFCILLGGTLNVTERLRTQLRDCRFIAADSGICHASTLGVTPELWLGDFDSAPPASFSAFADCPRQTYPTQKNATDGELAVNAALERGATKIILCGAFGGKRFDHALFHGVFAACLYEKGIDVLLTSGDTEGYPLNKGAQSFHFPPGTLFSIIGFSALQNLSIEGAKWPLQNHSVPFGSSLTLSNETLANETLANETPDTPLNIHIESGRALLIAYP